MSAYEFIEVEDFDASRVIKFNRPDCHNALNGKMIDETIRAMNSANWDTNIRSIILTGVGKDFCVGHDLSEDFGEKVNQMDISYNLETKWNPLIQNIRNSKKITVCSVQGTVAGTGLSLAFACDFLIAQTNTRFISGFNHYNLAPDAGLNFLLVRSLGYTKTLEFFLFDRPITAKKMCNYGLVNITAKNPFIEAQIWSRHVNDFDQETLTGIKTNLLAAKELSFQDSLAHEIQTSRSHGRKEIKEKTFIKPVPFNESRVLL